MNKKRKKLRSVKHIALSATFADRAKIYSPSGKFAERAKKLTTAKSNIARRSYMPLLTAFRCGHSLPCCRGLNAFETTTRACRHRAKGTEQKADRQTDGQTEGRIGFCPYRSWLVDIITSEIPVSMSVTLRK